MNSKLQKIGIIVTIISIALALIALVTGTSSIGKIILPDASSPLNKVSCDVVIDTTFFGSAPDIMGTSCVDVGECSILDRFSVQPLSLFTAEGQIVYDAGDVRIPQAISVSRLSGDTLFRQDICTRAASIHIKTLDGDGIQTDSKEVPVQ